MSVFNALFAAGIFACKHAATFAYAKLFFLLCAPAHGLPLRGRDCRGGTAVRLRMKPRKARVLCSLAEQKATRISKLVLFYNQNECCSNSPFIRLEATEPGGGIFGSLSKSNHFACLSSSSCIFISPLSQSQ